MSPVIWMQALGLAQELWQCVDSDCVHHHLDGADTYPAHGAHIMPSDNITPVPLSCKPGASRCTRAQLCLGRLPGHVREQPGDGLHHQSAACQARVKSRLLDLVHSALQYRLDWSGHNFCLGTLHNVRVTDMFGASDAW